MCKHPAESSLLFCLQEETWGAVSSPYLLTASQVPGILGAMLVLPLTLATCCLKGYP